MAIHKVNLKTWTEQGCVVIGFARKSTNPHVKDDIRVKNIQTMIEIFREKSGADRVYISPCINSTEPIASRDISINRYHFVFAAMQW